MEGENLVIIHAGLNDVLKGKSQNLQRQLEDGVRKLREASEGVHVTICTIPEVWGQSGGMERRVIEANCVIRAMSRQLSYSVMEVNKDVYEPGLRPFAQDGIHYSGATGRRALTVYDEPRWSDAVNPVLHYRSETPTHPVTISRSRHPGNSDKKLVTGGSIFQVLVGRSNGSFHGCPKTTMEIGRRRKMGLGS
ncbi:hypothetical protein HPB52_007039 [Rhipicephalus sanguineus]|uniref:Uncharacterized protein n=1 Tax=Rhipicephalus sanguineus TaxID=34632 RepID=A0A9D4Q549_RHISA|nr:hypothetical protein HPB52_007039 [Rhipicephalus sanguineus]